jgi:hypothetical protein
LDLIAIQTMESCASFITIALQAMMFLIVSLKIIKLAFRIMEHIALTLRILTIASSSTIQTFVKQ